MHLTKKASLTRSNPKPNHAGALSDIAFLLLVFFLVSTQLWKEKAISVVLPMKCENVKPTPIVGRNVLSVLINGKDDILLDGHQVQLEEVQATIVEFISNPEKDPNKATSPSSAIVSIKNDLNTSYDRYILVYQEVKKAYRALRENLAMTSFHSPLNQLDKEQAEYIAHKIPIRISEQDPMHSVTFK